jgi:hypothetical protein
MVMSLSRDDVTGTSGGGVVACETAEAGCFAGGCWTSPDAKTTKGIIARSFNM